MRFSTIQIKNRIQRKLVSMYLKKRYKPKVFPAYIHVPKTGGTYLAQLDSGALPVLFPFYYLGHTYIIDDALDMNVIYLNHDLVLAKQRVTRREDINNFFIFATVRNIFDWLVSYASFAGGWKYKGGNPSHYDYKNAKRGFEYLVKTIANREEPWPSRKLIHCQLFSSDGNLVVDWLNRTNTLDSDLHLLARKLNLYYKKREKQKVSKRNDYRNYYNDELINLVYDTWGRELKLFGFDFDNSICDNAILKREIESDIKKRIKYLYKEDVLMQDNVVIK